MVTCWLAVTWAAVPKLEPAQLQAPTLSALGKAEREPSLGNTNEFQNYSFKPKRKRSCGFLSFSSYCTGSDTEYSGFHFLTPLHLTFLMYLWCPLSNCKCCISRLFFSSFLLALYDLQVELFLLKWLPTYLMCPIYIFAGLRRLQFTREQCGWPLPGPCEWLMSVFGRPYVGFGHVQKRA